MAAPINLSDLVIRNPHIRSFDELMILVGQTGKDGGVLLQIDLKPDFPDTPRNWEMKVEAAFTWGGR